MAAHASHRIALPLNHIMVDHGSLSSGDNDGSDDLIKRFPEQVYSRSYLPELEVCGRRKSDQGRTSNNAHETFPSERRHQVE